MKPLLKEMPTTYWVAPRTAACVAGHVLQLEIENKNNQIEIILKRNSKRREIESLLDNK